jgi:myo-inositol-1(or 4)-monophosphatase
MTEIEPALFASFACGLADAARAVTLPAFCAGLEIENKLEGGFDPVTAADRGAEQVMREMIARTWPDHGISGEEFPAVPAQGPFAWSLDPIDGTRAFICGLPSWTTLIALLADGAPAVGVIDVPRMDERYVGAGDQAWLVSGGEERELRTSGCAVLAEARLSTTDPFLFEGAEAEGFARVRRATRVARYGLDAYGYARLAAGQLDLVVESGLHPHDWHALVPVIRGAGGAVGNWEGGGDLSQGRIVAAASDALFDATVALLKG